jgi:phenylacetate-CoA ligase
VHADALRSQEYRLESLVEARTGGSTGTALTIWFDTRCQQLRNAAALRSNRWSRWDIGTKVAAVWGNPPIATTAKEKIRNLLLDRMIYLDTMRIDEESIRRFAAAWRRERPRIIFGHSHSLYVLAVFLRRLGIDHVLPQGIVSTSMTLMEPERRVMEEVFQCRVTNRYGCEEVGLIACECEQHAGLHLNVDHLVVEFLREDGSPAGPGEEGEVVVTDLVNRGMPLIRYRVGDVGVPSARSCACGRGLPLMERLAGRQADFLKRVDGSLVAGVSLVERTLTAIPGIEQLQLVQDDLHRICARVVQDDRFDSASARQLHDALRLALGEQVEVEIRRVSELTRTSAGKYRFAICNV